MSIPSVASINSPGSSPETPQTPSAPLPSGRDYLDSLRDEREVWIYGERVADVTQHPAFRNQARMIARLYDALHDPATKDRVTAPSDLNPNALTHPFFKASRTIEELVAARDAIAAWQRIGYGWMGRSPDFVAALLGMLGPNAEIYGAYKDNARRWYQISQTCVPYVNHAIANPPVDRRLQQDATSELFIHVVRESDAGLVVSGAKNITTNAALSQYSFVGGDGGTFVKDKQMAVLFLMPMNAPGLKVICRPSYEMSAGVMGSPFDYPLSSRFDENDAIFILDEVLIPWENVLIYGDINRYNNHMNDAGLYHRVGLQACTRLAVKLDFIAGLLLKAVESTGVDQFRGVQMNVGEVVTWRHVFWSLSDAMCHSTTTLNGALIPKLEHMMSYRMLMAQAYPRVKEIVHQLVASGLIYQPSSARDWHAPELRPYLDKYVRSADGDAVSRIKLMKTLWDALGTEFGGRHELYERNHSGNHEAVRLHPLFHGMASGTIEQMKRMVDSCLSEVDLGGWTAPDLVNPNDINYFHIAPKTGPVSSETRAKTPDPSELLAKVAAWNDTARPYPRDKCIHQLFEAQAERTPDAIALELGDETMSYAELNLRANRLSHYLRGLGVEASAGGDTKVGLAMERSFDMVVATLAILKAGAAYVPLDVNYPEQRLAVMIEDSGIRLLLTQGHLAERISARLREQGRLQVIPLDAVRDEVARQPSDNLNNGQGTPEGLAYIMYTSGSTGQPKGICIMHRNVVRLVQNTNFARMTSEEVWLQHSPISFDAATLELWAPLLNGGKLVLLRPNMHSLEELGQAIHRHRVTSMFMTPVLFALMVDEHLEGLRPLRELIVGGDVMPVSHVIRALRSIPTCVFSNGYGPTENTTFSTNFPVLSADERITSIPIGRPIANSQAYVLDQHLQLQPPGVAGDLYVGGDGVARGYHNRPELTAEKFIPNPFGPGHLYKTGDLARWMPDGNIEFAGRADTQVKLRGFRIELGDVIHALTNHPDIQDATVIAREDKPGDKRLVAYVVLDKQAKEWNPNILREHLHKQLPPYMMPSAFVRLDAMPLGLTGKIDHRALPAPELVHSEPGEASGVPGGDHAPRNAVEAVIADIWREVMGKEKLGYSDNFFDLGGHSLQAMQIMTKLNGVFKIQFPLSRFFEHATIAELATMLAQYEQKPGQLERLARLQQRLGQLAK